MEGVGSTGVLIFVPLVFTVVVQLSSLARKSTEEVSSIRGQRRLLLPDRLASPFRVPSLGRLNLVHTINCFLMAGTFRLAFEVDPGLRRNVLLVLTLILWFALPLLEVDCYVDLKQHGVIPRSLYFHFGTTLLVAVVGGSVFPGGVLSKIRPFSDSVCTTIQSLSNAPLLAYLSLLLLFASIYGFLLLVEDEVERATDRTGFPPLFGGFL